MAISDVQQALAEGALLLGELLGVGGDLWEVRRPGGDGITGSAAPAPIGTWPGRVKRSQSTTLVVFGQGASALPGGRASTTEYHALGIDGAIAGDPAPSPATLQVGDELISVAEPALRFRIKAPYAVAGYARFILEVL